MKRPSNIAHPLKNRTGTSQRNRVLEALNSNSALIDGNTLVDRLYLISEYARQINYYKYKKTEIDGESQELDNWSLFFKDSLPFQLAILSKTSIDKLDAQFLLLYEELKANPSKESLESLFNFILNKIIVPTTLLYKTVENNENSFTESLLAIIKSSFKEPIKSFICLYNSSANFLCITKKNFIDFINMPWQLKVVDIYALDLCIKHVRNGKKEAFLKAGEALNTIFQQVLSGMQNIVTDAPDYIEESLIPLKESLQKKHEPHIALLFAFLELFKHFQGNINELSKKHLDFFYEQVLKMIPKDAVPDMAHIVFEIANHQNEYLLKKDLLLKDGKDINKQDIQFGLDHEIVLDKAQVKDLKTLSLYPIKDSNDDIYIEGVYIAPAANKADGKEKDFKDNQAKNWPTLGSKDSKYILEGNESPEEYPKARLGFVLASPVFLLEEGKRVIKIRLNCNYSNANNLTQAELGEKINEAVYKLVDQELAYSILEESILTDFADVLTVKAISYLKNIFLKENSFKIYESELDDFFKSQDPISCKPIFKESDIVILTSSLESGFIEKVPLFNVKFSGEEEWIPSNPITTVSRLVSGTVPSNNIEFLLEIELGPEIPAITFYNEEKLKEKIDLKILFPLVKIELNEEIKINCTFESSDDNKNCCLKNKIKSGDTINFSPYHFLQKLILEDAHIDVKVCGVKNLIVQNDENLQDVNKPIFPFGPRPKVDASFMIGSKEVFCKNWESFRLNVKWKDLPVDSAGTLDFNDHYEAYNQNPPPTISNNSFNIKGSVLENGNWETNGSKNLFLPIDSFFECPDIDGVKYDNGFKWERNSLGNSSTSYIEKSMPIEYLIPLNVNSRKGFFRLELKGQDFQHDRYAFVLAQQMFKLAKVADLIKSAAFIQKVKNSCQLANSNEDKINIILTEVNNEGGAGGTITDEIANQLFGTLFPLEFGLANISDRLESLVCGLEADINALTGGNDVVLPNEPYTPVIKSLSIDYHAIATKKDLDIIHLYPYKNTSKLEDVEKNPTLFPYFDDEGTLFIGIENITKGGNLSMLFQLAEATANSEFDRAKINWHYLRNNKWKPLEYDFDVISDETDGFTVSGIVTVAVPNDINNIGNTVMPEPLYWLKVSTPENVKAVAETIGVHTQAVKTSARFNKLSDKSRLENALEAGSIAKLVKGDFNVKKAEQIYPSFGGRKPEANGHFYTRVSEHLKHKGRALMLNDYEKIVLEGFPEIYKAKCITHTMGLSAIDYERDLEIAPGYVVVTVIPDLTKLKSGNLQEPKVPISLLERIGNHIRKRTSPFARLKVMNPRFEYVDVSISVRLHRGKSDDFYKRKLKEDIHLFLAPWSLGDSEKLAFGQVVLFSDIVGFVEQLDYVDFIANLNLKGTCDQTGSIIKPLTARSVLTGGIICVDTNKEECLEDRECIDNQETSILINHIN